MVMVCHLTTVHPRFDTRIFVKEAKSLSEQKLYKVVLIVADGKGDVNQENDGVSIRDLGYLGGGRIMRALIGPWRSLNVIRNIKPALVHFHDPELIPLGLLLRIIGYKVIYDVHEDVAKQTLSKDYLPRIIRKPIAAVISAVEWAGARVFDAIIPATPKIAEHFPSHKTVIVQNFPIINELVNTEQSPSYSMRPKSFAYVGVISKNRGAIEMLHALALIRDMPDIRLQLAGNFSPYKLDNDVKELMAWISVDYYGHISRQQMMHLLGNVRAGLVLFHPLPNHIDAQPNKLFEYMSAGLPIIASDFPLWRSIIDDVGCGLLVNPLNPEAIADAMRWILEHPHEAESMGQRGQKAVAQIYNWAIESAKLKSLYEKLLAQ